MAGRIITRFQKNRGSEVFFMLPPDAWTAICEALGINGIKAEATNTLFLENLRESRTCLKLPKRYACRFNGVIRGQVEGRPYSGRYDPELYAGLLIDIVNRYPDLQVIDTTAIWEGRMSFGNDHQALTTLMDSLYFDDLAPMLKRLIVQPHASFVVRYMLECVRGVLVEPPLSHDVMAFLAAGNAYGYNGSTKVTITVEKEYLTNKAHYYEPVRATTPGGSEFEIWWKERGAGCDSVMMQENFAEERPESAAFGPDGDDLDWEHPEFVEWCRVREAEMLEGWALNLKMTPFALLLDADNGCDSTCCKIQLVKKGEDFRICPCHHKRPIFAPVPKEDRRRTRSESKEERCVCSQQLVS